MQHFLSTLLIVGFTAVRVLAAAETMPVTQQNALVQKYCAVCHNDAHKNGRLSLEHFDAAKPDPGDAAMIVSKLKTGAMGAAGVPQPDRATVDALTSALSAKAAGAGDWIVKQAPSQIVTASIVQAVPSTAKEAIVSDLFRLTLRCNVATREAEAELAWSPGTPPNGQEMSGAVDGQTAFQYKVEGSEKMGNGTGGSSGPGAAILPKFSLPAETLTIANAFPNETVVFSFARLTQPVRQTLSTCFAGL